jgi:predicted DCC family thiol-disulfide oxidoreductase YuxK
LNQMTAAEQSAVTGRPIVLYDGVCGLCNRVIQLLLRVDRGGVLRFAPLESPLAVSLLKQFPAAPMEPEGVILISNALTPGQRIFRRSDAVSEALRLTGGGWRRLGFLVRLVPRAVREWGYGIVARYRYRLFGKFATCPIPTEAQRSRILGMYPSP